MDVRVVSDFKGPMGEMEEWVKGQHHALAALPLEKEPLVLRLDEMQRQSRCFGVEKNLLCQGCSWCY
jgi:hypothetical protein